MKLNWASVPCFNQDTDDFWRMTPVGMNWLSRQFYPCLTTLDSSAFKPNFASVKVISKPTLCLDALFGAVGINIDYIRLFSRISS